MSKIDIMRATLNEWAARPFAWARDNCALSVLRYVEGVRGYDYPLPPEWSEVASEADAQAALEIGGGMVALGERVADYFGLIGVREPQVGDVGVVRMGEVAVFAIATGPDRWAARTQGGVLIEPARPLRIWGV